jgi:hypothetical protein
MNESRQLLEGRVICWVCELADIHGDGQPCLVPVGEDCPACGAAEGDEA